MKLAIEHADRAIESGQSPFGSVIVRGGEVLAASHNEVWQRLDPTAHAEVVAIRTAAAAIGSIDLSGCVLYSTCEPCPMCACAIHWAKLDAVCYGAGIADAEFAGFGELTVPIDELYRRGSSPVKLLSRVLRDECAALFPKWKARPGSRAY
jgi:tRNA(Arg) A34 adenosine deaminase TadA